MSLPTTQSSVRSRDIGSPRGENLAPRQPVIPREPGWKGWFEGGAKELLRQRKSWLVSAALHAIILASFAAIVFHAKQQPSPLGIEAILGEDTVRNSFETLLESSPVILAETSTAESTQSDAHMLADQAVAESAARAMGDLARLGNGGLGDGTGEGGGGGRGPGLVGGFFGTQTAGNTFVYVVDMSGSMAGDRFRRAISELIKSINKLKGEQSFYVYFFNDRAFPLFDPKPAKSLISASTANKQRASRWIRSRQPSSTTNPMFALQQALEMKPDVIFLLTDGELDDPTTVRKMIRQYNEGTQIHTIAFENEEASETLKTIANENHGTFRFVR